MKLSIGLNKKPSGSSSSTLASSNSSKSNKAAPAKVSAFADDSEELDVPPSAGARPGAPVAPRTNAPLSRNERLKLQEAEALNANVFEYDNVYDAMKSGERVLEAKRKEEAKDRKVSPSLSEFIGTR